MSLTAREAMYSQETGEVFLELLEISHADLSSPIRVVNNTVDITHNSNTYSAFPFKIQPPGEKQSEITRASLTIDAVDRTVIQAIRSISTPATVTYKVILASAPDTVEAGPFVFSLKNTQYTAYQVSGELVYEDRLFMRVPYLKFSPRLFPGLF
jgi:hypothetical protein